MLKISKNKAGLAFGALLGLSHLGWGVLVAAGLAQAFMDWIFRIHFIQPPYTITPFHWGAAVALVLFTFAVGYVSGWILGALWNWLQSMSPEKAA